MKLRTIFELPESIAAGLAMGRLVRRGGVIQRATGHDKAGEVVMWLRESSVQPFPAQQLAESVGRNTSSLLQLAHTGISLLNLGATVSFGLAALSKLRSMGDSIDEVREEVKGLRWAVDLGFQQTLEQLGRVEDFLELQLAAKILSAAKQAWEAQLLKPGSRERSDRLRDARSSCSDATEHLVLLASKECQQAMNDIPSPPALVFRHLESYEDPFRRARTALTALRLEASIVAEMGEIRAATEIVESGSSRVFGAAMALLHRILRADGSDTSMLRCLLQHFSPDEFPFHRVLQWLLACDVEFNSIDLLETRAAAIDYLRKEGILDDSEIGVIWIKWLRRNAPDFFELVDGVLEDNSRLLGAASEYRYCSANREGLPAYRESLTINELPENSKVIYFQPQKAAY